MSTKSFIRVRSIVIKESRQVLRDPSSILIAFVLPLILLMLFAYGINLDVQRIPVGIALESGEPLARQLAETFRATSYFDVTVAPDRRELLDQVTSGGLRGVIIIPQDFPDRLTAGDASPVFVVTDGSETSTANFVRNYSAGVLDVWRNVMEMERRTPGTGRFELKQRYWYNAELESKNALVPGSLAIVMTIVGTLLTSLVVAREWERGTMEALLSTPVSPLEMLIGKVVPYLVLGFVSLMGAVLLAIFFFGVPYRGSVLGMLVAGSAFLLTALGQGFLISTTTKNQFVASMVALITAFLPSFLLSGFIFEIASMPFGVRQVTRIIPARYFVTNLQTLFLAGDVWEVILPNTAFLLLIAGLFFGITLRKYSSRLEA